MSKESSQQKYVLERLLDCGYADLEVLNNIQYELDEIFDFLIEENLVSLDYLLDEVFDKGKQELINTTQNRLSDLKEESKKINQEIKILECLDTEEDIGWQSNGIDSFIYLKDGRIYKRYFADEIESIEKNMGFEFRIL